MKEVLIKRHIHRKYLHANNTTKRLTPLSNRVPVRRVHDLGLLIAFSPSTWKDQLRWKSEFKVTSHSVQNRYQSNMKFGWKFNFPFADYKAHKLEEKKRTELRSNKITIFMLHVNIIRIWMKDREVILKLNHSLQHFTRVSFRNFGVQSIVI